MTFKVGCDEDDKLYEEALRERIRMAVDSYKQKEEVVGAQVLKIEKSVMLSKR
ncbi:hypothetical protein O9993_19715 [Vibrio lentus]|nr:hypothetical protein [Vibrio lentus]